MGELTVRPATPADVPAIAAIYGHSVINATASFEVVPPEESEMARRMKILTDGGFPYLVVEREGEVLGYGYAGPYHARAGYRNTVEDTIYLAEKARGQGVGGFLLRSLIDAATQLGFRQMIAVIGDSNHHASIRLHRAAGFEQVGLLKDAGYKHGQWLDVVLMQRVLGPGASVPPDSPPLR